MGEHQEPPVLETGEVSVQMLRKREGECLDSWLADTHESNLAELVSFAHGVEQDKAAMQAGLKLPINYCQAEGHATRVKRDLAHDVRQGGICTASSTCSSPHLET